MFENIHSFNIKTNGLKALSKYPIRYLKLAFVLTNFKMTMLLTYTKFNIPNSYGVFFCTMTCFFSFFYLTKSQSYYTIKVIIILSCIANCLNIRILYGQQY